MPDGLLRRCLLALVFIVCTFKLATGETISRIILLVDSYQVSMPTEFAAGLVEAQSSFTNMTLSQQPVFLNSKNTSFEEEAVVSMCREFSAGVTLVLDVTASGWPRGRLISDALGIPYLRAEASVAPFARAATAYALRLNASDAALIFQNEAEMEQAISGLLGSSKLRFTVHNRLSEQTAKLLRDTMPWPDIFILFTDSQRTAVLLRAAIGSGLVTQDQQWLLVMLNFPGTVRNDWTDDLPVAVGELRPSVPELCCPLQGEYAGCDCSPETEVVTEFLGRTASFVAEIILNSGSELEKPRKLDCSVTATTVDDETAIVLRRERFSQLVSQLLPRYPALVYDFDKRLLAYSAAMEVSVARARNAGRSVLGSWSQDRGLVVISGRQIAGPRKFIRVGMVEALPWTRRDNVTQQWSGYCYDFLVKLSDILDIDYEIAKPNPKGIGERLADGTWTGLLQQLSKREIELIVAPLTMTAEREEVVDFVVPYFDQSGITIVMREPAETTSLFKFMTVLKLEVWLSIVGALSVTGFMIWLLDRLSPYSYQNDPARYPYPCRQFTMKESFWFALTSFTPQGGGEAPKALSARALVAAYWLFVVLMLATFTANLAAFLTVERLQVTIQSLEQLARQTRVSYTVQNNSMAHQFFLNMKNAENVLYRSWMQTTLGTAGELTIDEISKYRVWNYPIREQWNIIMDHIEKVTTVETAKEGIDKVLASEDGTFAFIHDAAWLRYQVSQSCLLAEVGEMFAEQPYALAVYPGHPLSQDLSRAILTLQRDRFFEELTARYWNQSFRAECPSASDSEGISLDSIGGVFIATACGLVLAMFTLLGEILYHHYQQKKKDPQLKKAGEEIREPELEKISEGVKRIGPLQFIDQPPFEVKKASFTEELQAESDLPMPGMKSVDTENGLRRISHASH